MWKSSPSFREISPPCGSNQGAPTQERACRIWMLLCVLDQALFRDNDHRRTSITLPHVTKMVTVASIVIHVTSNTQHLWVTIQCNRPFLLRFGEMLSYPS